MIILTEIHGFCHISLLSITVSRVQEGGGVLVPPVEGGEEAGGEEGAGHLQQGDTHAGQADAGQVPGHRGLEPEHTLVISRYLAMMPSSIAFASQWSEASIEYMEQ